MQEPIISLQPVKVKPYQADVVFIGGSMDGVVKQNVTIYAKMDGVEITLKQTKERYKYEHPLTFRFIGMEQESEVITREYNWKQKLFQRLMNFVND